MASVPGGLCCVCHVCCQASEAKAGHQGPPRAAHSGASTHDSVINPHNPTDKESRQLL
jgi:hypothetical protein